MKTLKDLVPPLELCKQIPAYIFDDSGLVWERRFRLDGTELDPGVNTRKNALCQDIICPAPTLQEILEKIRISDNVAVCAYGSDGLTINGEGFDLRDNAATAALKRWLQIIGVKDDETPSHE